MSESKFPLCEKLGLEIVDWNAQGKQFKYVRASDLERILEQASVVSNNQDDFTGSPWRYVHGRNPQLEGNTHTARLLMIEPIRKESEERKLLRELIERFPNGINGLGNIISRAEKLLEREG